MIYLCKFLYVFIQIFCYRVPIANIFHQRHCGRRKRSIPSTRKKRDAYEKVDNQKSNPSNKVEELPTKGVIKIELLDTNTKNIVSSSTNVNSSSDPQLFETSKSVEKLAYHTSQNMTEDYLYTSNEEEEYDYDGYDYYDYSEDLDDCNDFSYLVGKNSEGYSNIKDETENELPGAVHCDFIATLDRKCLEQSILEIWMYHEETINRLTQEDILFAINKLKESPFYGYDYNYTDLLGDIIRNSSGHVIAASSALHHYVTVVNLTKASEVDLESLGIKDAGTDPDAKLDEVNYIWQKEVIDMAIHHDLSSEANAMTLNVRMTRSFTDVSSSAIFFDMIRVAVCIIIMYLYTSIMLGRMDIIEQRFYLTAAGIVSIALGMLISIGISAALGYAYSPHHALLPFVMIGIGVDDMFVIVDSWYNIPDIEKKKNSLQKNVGLALKHSGVAITVTSLTDFCAFSIGCVTMLPGLESFCLNCAIGIAAIYFLQLSWFVAWMVIDQKRIEENRVSVLPCIQINKEKTGKSEEGFTYSFEDLRKAAMNWYTNLLSYYTYCTFILLVTFAILGLGIYGTMNIETHTEEVKNLPSDSYLRKWFNNLDSDFPELGQKAKLFTGELRTKQDFTKLDMLINDLEILKENQDIVKDLDSWWASFKAFLNDKYGMSNWVDMDFESVENPTSQTYFNFLLSDFLHSSRGGKYASNIVLNGTLECNSPAPFISASSSDFVYQKFHGPKEAIESVNVLQDMIEAQNFSSEVFTSGRSYGSWEIDKVIFYELWRNLVLAIICVFVITFVLLSNFKASFLVLICVVFTLIDVVGILHLWGITVDVPSCSCIVMSVGLCVDYSAHIAHAFLVSSGIEIVMFEDNTYLVKYG